MELSYGGGFWNDLVHGVWVGLNMACSFYEINAALAHFGLATPPTATVVAIMDVGCGIVGAIDMGVAAWYFTSE